MGEILFQIIFEIGAYFVGKTFLNIFVPNIGIEQLTKQKSSPKWKWKGFTYKKGNRKYFYAEAIQFIGLLVIVFATILLIGAFNYAN